MSAEHATEVCVVSGNHQQHHKVSRVHGLGPVDDIEVAIEDLAKSIPVDDLQLQNELLAILPRLSGSSGPPSWVVEHHEENSKMNISISLRSA